MNCWKSFWSDDDATCQKENKFNFWFQVCLTRREYLNKMVGQIWRWKIVCARKELDLTYKITFYVAFTCSLFDIFKKAIPGLFLFIFGLFKQTLQCEKCPSSIQRWGSNPRPLKHESSPITTRPRLPPFLFDFYLHIY